MNVTAVFESWHIADGNYPPFRKGQRVNLSFEVEPDSIQSETQGKPDKFLHQGCGQYEFVGTIVRIYRDDSQDPVVIIQAGNFRFYLNRSLDLAEGTRVQGLGTLCLDHYLWVEFLRQYVDPPELFYQLRVERIQRVEAAAPFIPKFSNGKTMSTSVDSVANGANMTDLDTMEGQQFEAEFYLLDLSDVGVDDVVPRTFLSVR